MSLSNYTELYAAVADLLNKKNLTAQVPTFVRLFEAQANRDIKHFRMEGRMAFTLDGSPKALPCGYKGAISFKAGIHDLIYVTPDMFDSPFDAGWPTNGSPRYYTIIGNQFHFSPQAGEHDAVVRYMSAIPTLGDDCPTNWLLSNHPDVYLYGAAMQSAPYLRDDERLGMWSSFVNSAIDGINRDSIETQFGAHAEVQVRSIA